MICNTTIQTIDKALIAERFAKARNTYGSKARVQQLVAEKMLHLLMEHTCTPAAVRNISCNASPFQHIAEFGCGTGYYSRLLLHSLQPDTLLLNDLCSEMEECVKELCTSPAVHFCAGDAELMSFPQETDLITSCSTLQWFSNPEDFFVRCHHFLTDSGILAFSTFGKENMQEIRNLTGNGLDYLSLEELKTSLSSRYDILHAEEKIVTLPFATPLLVLQHLKQTGVTGTEKKIWTRGRLQTFCNDYVRLFSNVNHDVVLTYHPIYIIAKKR